MNASNSVVRWLSALALTALLASPAALAVDSGEIIVVSTKGEVHFIMNGAARSVRAGGALELPATVRTGRDGAVELKQGATTVSVGPETLLEFPAHEKRGASVDRIVQPRGNAFYNIGKREGRKFRVETPYLVGVVKGTQFNVAAESDATTISLFEGLLEVRATDDSDVVDLKAGEIATRKGGDKSISVLKMDGGNVPPTGPRSPAGSGSRNDTQSPPAPRVTPSNEGGESLHVDRGGGRADAVPDAVDSLRNSGSSVVMNTTMGLGNGVEVGDVGVGTRVDAGPIAVDTSAAVNLNGTGVELTTSATVDAGPVAVDMGAGTSVDLGTGTIDTAAAASVDAGPLTTDLGTSAAVDLGAGTLGAGVDVGAGTPLAAVDVGASAAIDVTAASVDLGLTVAGADLGLGLDLGLDNADTTPDTGSTDTSTDTADTGTVVDVGGLLNNLLRRPGTR